MSGVLNYNDALAAIRRLIELSEARGTPVGPPVVLLGGTAMAARGIRSLSADVDIYAAEVAPQAVFEVERELRAVHGDTFRLDATATENLWGPILVRDVEASDEVATIETDRASYSIRALSVDDLFLLKLSADRAKDEGDFALLAAETHRDSLVARFNQLVAWHGDRGALLGYADAFVARLVALFDADPETLIESMRVPEYVARELRETWRGT